VSHMGKTIYLDNAATSFPKPEGVYKEHDSYFRQAANPGRGAHQRAVESARAVFEARQTIADFLNIASSERLIFTPGCTYSINFALRGFKFHPGDCVLVGPLEHNAVMRPLHLLTLEKKLIIHTLDYDPQCITTADSVEQSIREHKPRLCVLSEISNVTGAVLDVPTIADICSTYHVPLMIDAAQSVGFTDQRIDDLNISIWCASGHKGLMGAPGVGLLYVAPSIHLEPLIAGGTGSRSESLEMPEFYPDHLEAGTGPGPAIAALRYGVDWLQKTGLEAVRSHEVALAQEFLRWAESSEAVQLVGAPGRSAIVSFQVKNMTPDRVADLLDSRYSIAVRPGLHCAFSAHQTLGTVSSGLIRISFGYFNSVDEVKTLCDALSEIFDTACTTV
jgi:cysteine desulfurase / selenocysteine lyase